MPFKGRNPFEELEELLERMSQEFDTDLGGRLSPIPVDVRDEGDSYVVAVDLPGVEKDAVEVSITDSTLRVQATAPDEEEDEEEGEDAGEYLRRERRSRSGSRTVTLPGDVSQDGVEATLSNGVLTVRLPKVDPGEGGRQIEIS